MKPAMGTTAAVLAVLTAMAFALRLRSEQRRRGIKTNWPKSLAAMAGSIVIALAAIGVLFAGLTTNWVAAGSIGCAVILIGGMIGLVIWLNRRWPAPSA